MRSIFFWIHCIFFEPGSPGLTDSSYFCSPLYFQEVNTTLFITHSESMRLIYFIVIRITFKNNVVKNLLWRFEVVHFHSNSVFLSILHASLHLLVHLLLLYLRSLLAFMTLYFKLFRCLEALSLRILSSKKTRVKVNQIGINLETRKKAPSWKIIRLLSYNLITWAQWILEVFLNTQ